MIALPPASGASATTTGPASERIDTLPAACPLVALPPAIAAGLPSVSVFDVSVVSAMLPRGAETSRAVTSCSVACNAIVFGVNGFSAPGSVPPARNVTSPGARNDGMVMSLSSSTEKSPADRPLSETRSVRTLTDPSDSILALRATSRVAPKILPVVPALLR